MHIYNVVSQHISVIEDMKHVEGSREESVSFRISSQDSVQKDLYNTIRPLTPTALLD